MSKEKLIEAAKKAGIHSSSGGGDDTKGIQLFLQQQHQGGMNRQMPGLVRDLHMIRWMQNRNLILPLLLLLMVMMRRTTMMLMTRLLLPLHNSTAAAAATDDD